MTDILIEFKDQILDFGQALLPTFVVSFMALGIVYTVGRLLDVVKTDQAKNVVAAICILLFSFLYQREFVVFDFELLWNVLKLTTFSTIIYILLCWRLFSRIDSLLDKRLGKDLFKAKKKRKRKKKKGRKKDE